MKFIDDCRNWHRFWSVRLAIVAGAAETLNQLVPLWGHYIPWWVSPALITASVISRFIKQNLDYAQQN